MTPMDRLEVLLDATPDNGEGSAFHRRSEFLWQLRDDVRRIDDGDESILADFEGFSTLADARAACERDAQRAVERWSEEGPLA